MLRLNELLSIIKQKFSLNVETYGDMFPSAGIVNHLKSMTPMLSKGTGATMASTTPETMLGRNILREVCCGSQTVAAVAVVAVAVAAAAAAVMVVVIVVYGTSFNRYGI